MGSPGLSLHALCMSWACSPKRVYSAKGVPFVLFYKNGLSRKSKLCDLEVVLACSGKWQTTFKVQLSLWLIIVVIMTFTTVITLYKAFLRSKHLWDFFKNWASISCLEFMFWQELPRFLTLGINYCTVFGFLAHEHRSHIHTSVLMIHSPNPTELKLPNVKNQVAD